jgi:hypothetical protein
VGNKHIDREGLWWLGGDARELIAVADAGGRRVAGRAEISADESHWKFVPGEGLARRPLHAAPASGTVRRSRQSGLRGFRAA